MRLGSALMIAAIGLASMASAASIEPYKKQSGVSGSLNFIGSDTMINLMTHLGEKFGTFYPSVRVQGEGKGSSSAPPALIEGTAQLGPMSREMKASEIDAFEQKFGYKPTQFKVALDGLAVYVHKDNPIAEKGLTMQQIDAIFSKTRKGGATADIATWGELGLTGEWASKPISLYGRNSASGTYGFFKEVALHKGDFKDTVKEQPGSGAVVQGVENDRYAIGYSGIGYVTSGVHKVAIVTKEGAPPVAPSLETVLAGSYPLGRFLYVYVNQAPGKPLDPLVREFITFALSTEGQEQVEKAGFIPVPAEIVVAELTKRSGASS
jgi:phosphate transport system substrate-binding protein